MKKEQTNKTKKLTLGKMTVAKLLMSEQQMKYIVGGDAEATKPVIRPLSKLGDNCTATNHTNPV